MKKILVVIGTRPDVIKMAPLIRALQAENNTFFVKICDTGQHLEMKRAELDFFQIVPDYQLNALSENQSLSQLIAYLLQKFQELINDFQPDLIIVQGDTASALAASLVSFNHQIPLAHVEAGLRTYDRNAPYPEEINRQLIARLGTMHFAPTALAKENLLAERIDSKNIYVVGNTIVDALQFTMAKIRQKTPPLVAELTRAIQAKRQADEKMVLITLHRRENLDHHLVEITQALQTISQQHKLFFLFPVHGNPRVQSWASELAAVLPNILLTQALPYAVFVWAMQASDLILTDSGGIQEEAPTIGKPVVVMRNATERQEALRSGVVRHVSVKKNEIIEAVQSVFQQGVLSSGVAGNPFGKGDSARQIVACIKNFLLNAKH